MKARWAITATESAFDPQTTPISPVLQEAAGRQGAQPIHQCNVKDEESKGRLLLMLDSL